MAIYCQCRVITSQDVQDAFEKQANEDGKNFRYQDALSQFPKPKCGSCINAFINAKSEFDRTGEVPSLPDYNAEKTSPENSHGTTPSALCSFEGRQGAGPVPATQAGQPLILSNIPIIAADHPANQK